MIGYFFLFATIVIETLAVILMKLANGFENKIYFGLGILAFITSFIFLSMALKSLPMGWANAIWAGSSTLLVCLVGYVYFEEKINWIQGIFLLCIVVGLVGLNFFGKGK